MKILLIYPKCPDTFWSFKYALKFVSKKATLPPLGLVTVAAMLPVEWEKRLVDLNVRKLKESDLDWADYAFISAMTIQRDSAREIIRRCQKKGLKTVAGGPLFTTESSDFPEVDHLVLNEAENTLAPFLEDLANGCAKHSYTSNVYPEIQKTPIPDWQLIDMKKYEAMCIQYSRGCPFHCEFCGIVVLNGRIPRLKSSSQIIAELEALYKTGWRGGVFFVDDNFIGNQSELKKDFLPALIDWMTKMKYPFNFYTESSINLADDEELMHLMTQAGFYKVFIGIETPHPESLVECNKYTNNKRDLLSCVKKIQSSGFEVQGGFIIGFDNDPPSIFEKQIQFIQQSGIVTAMVGLLTAMRGTMLYKRLEKEERLVSDTSGNNTDLSLNFIPKMKMETLINGYKKVLKSIYTPKEYYKRVITFLKTYEQKVPLAKVKIRFNDIRAFLRSIWRIGFIGKERYYYWKLIAWTLVKRPKLLNRAVTMAIFGFNFRKAFSAY